MKVVWLCHYPLDQLGELPVAHRKKEIHPVSWIVNLSNAIACSCPNIELHIITTTPLISKSFSKKKNGITIYVLRDECGVPFTYRGWPSYLPLHLICRYWPTRMKIGRMLRKLKPDIVHAHGTEMAWGMIAVNSGFPNIISVQGMMHKLAEHYPDDCTYRMRIPMEKHVMQRGKYFISKTPFARRFIEEMSYGATIFDIENAMNPVFFEVQPDYTVRRRVIFVGTATPAKGLGELCEAVSRIDKLELVVACKGGGSFLQGLKQKYANIPIHWKGFLSVTEIAEEMKTSDMLVLPSYMDTSPNVVSEAMSAGLPVVATNVGGIPDMVDDGRTGLLVPPQKVEPLVDAIASLLNDPVKMERIGRAAREEAVKRFSSDEAVRKCYAAYEQVIED